MIVDGKRLPLGIHNWSNPGVTLNRDASLLFDDEEIAGYYAEALEIDWELAAPIRPKKFVRPTKEELAIREAVDAPAHRSSKARKHEHDGQAQAADLEAGQARVAVRQRYCNASTAWKMR